MRLIGMEKNLELGPQGKYAQLTLDFPFKKAFATEGEEELLIAMLNAFLEKKLSHPITEVVIQNPYIQGQTRFNRDAVLDIRCRDSVGNRFIVEMQTGRQRYFIKRSVYYSSMAISDSGQKGGDWNFNFPNVYSLNFLDYDIDFGEGNDDVVQYISPSNEKYPRIRYDYENLIFVRLTEFKKTLSECESFSDKLLYSLRHAHELDGKPEQFSGKLFDRLFEIAKIANFTPEEVLDYEASRMRRWDEYAIKEFAREEGVEEGIAIGDARNQEKFKAFVSLLESGVPLTDAKQRFGIE